MPITATVFISLNFPVPPAPPHFFSPSCSSLVSCINPFNSVHFRATRSPSGDQHYVDLYHHSLRGLDPHSEVRDPTRHTYQGRLRAASMTARALSPSYTYSNLETFKTQSPGHTQANHTRITGVVPRNQRLQSFPGNSGVQSRLKQLHLSRASQT